MYVLGWFVLVVVGDDGLVGRWMMVGCAGGLTHLAGELRLCASIHDNTTAVCGLRDNQGLGGNRRCTM